MLSPVFLKNRGLLLLQGADRISFLQGLVTQDVTLLQERGTLYTAALTPKGKYLFDFFLMAYEDHILIDIHQEQRDLLKNHFLKYKLRSKINLEPFEQGWGVVSLPSESSSPEGIRFQDPRTPLMGDRWIGPIESFPLETSWGSLDHYEEREISLGLPAFPYDLIPEKTIILETGFQDLRGISWNKGCYIGQELMSRTYHQGVLRKRLFPVTLSGKANSGEKILYHQEEVGVLSHLQSLKAVALLRLEAVQQAWAQKESLHTATGIALEVKKPFWWAL